ncbi:hypothetical protein DES53_101907 [Roseimicrobium gellanilyticum]|uniref:Lipoprotein n=1 Tax=Roseimicrobium gellanilyticum TaxID=748857 RepID=A0A366HVI4_9BACT|nr:hypothetical protein [Roseimicrobium gellanilyticum]RBP48107.1 hypothetical protein DES53_101907 [Roseimicrobium gellanilyticum]
MIRLLKRLKVLLLATGMLAGGTSCSTGPDPSDLYFGKPRLNASPPRHAGISRGE